MLQRSRQLHALEAAAPPRTLAAVLPWLAFASALLGSACGRGAPLPDLSGTLVDVVVHAGLHGAATAVTDAGVANGAGPILLDSIAFGRLGFVVAGEPFPGDVLLRQVRRDVTLVDPRDVLICPSREPCRLRDDATFLTVWDAGALDSLAAVFAEGATGAVMPAAGPRTLEVIVSRVTNAERLYTLTRHDTRRLVLRGSAAGGWRLTAMERLD